ncbi:hypothetical protein [Demequina subtropica]|uniref:hypothetical protein n=1 Tax=Demequina subtropica TaxID=1638989 RepID=UPI000784428A|nr:hypothetical protein [Demequina subtropica]
MEGWAYAGAVVVAALVGVAVMRAVEARRHRALGIGVGIVVAAALGITATSVGEAIAARDTQPLLQSSTLDGSGVGFSAEIRNERLSFDGSTYVFRYGDGSERLVEELLQAYPGGIVEDDWTVVVDGLRYRVARTGLDDAAEGDDVYILSSDTLTVTDGHGASFEIPFPPVADPTTALATAETDTQWEVGAFLSEPQLADYYDALGGVARDGDAFIVPTSEGGSARVWFPDPTTLSVARA